MLVGVEFELPDTIKQMKQSIYVRSTKMSVDGGRVEYTVSSVRWDTYFQANRVENQKLNQTTAELPFG